MAQKDQPALSVSHEVEGDVYRLSFENLGPGPARRVALAMSVQSAHELASAIEHMVSHPG